MNEQVYRNYRLVLPGTEFLGTLVVRDGRIAEIEPDSQAMAGAHIRAGVDGDGQYLLPGLMELHTDTLENCAMPRPGVAWPLDLAVVHQDRLLLNAGITTACNALAIRDVPHAAPAAERISELVAAMTQVQAAGRLLADHRLHLRCELTCPAAPDVLEHFLAHPSLAYPSLALVSLMDHRAGQRQFQSHEALCRYYFGKYGLSAPEVAQFLQASLRTDEEISENRRRIVALAKMSGCLLASHDDATTAHVQAACEEGAHISEFPTTPEAAQAAHHRGLAVLMGAPNLIIGGSHSGNLSSLEVARRGILTLLSSDYAPHSLLPAVFRLTRDLGIPLSTALETVTRAPAELLSLSKDRGSLEIGKRADLITVQVNDLVPLITSVMVAGRRVA